MKYKKNGDYLEKFNFFKFWFKLILFRFVFAVFGMSLIVSTIFLFRVQGLEGCEGDNVGRMLGISSALTIFSMFQIRKLVGGFILLDKKYSIVDKYIAALVLIVGLFQGFFIKHPC